MKFLVSETGEEFVGNFVIERVPEFDANCAITTNTFQYVVSIFGSSSSPVAFQGTAVGLDSETLPVSGSVSGTSMTLTIGNELNATATLTQIDSQPPSSANSGQYSGSYTVTPSCPNGQFSTTGALSGALFQTGDTLTGSLVATEQRHTDPDQQGNCFFHDVPRTIPIFLNATIMGSAIHGFLLPFGANDSGDQGDDEPLAFSGTISGNTISGSATESRDAFSFTLNRTSSTPGPIITGFRADPPSAGPGQAVTLRWSTVNATSVSIDNGVGPQPPSGSVAVRPALTTTYTLTATGSGGSATATVTVTISSSGGSLVVVSNPPRGFVQRAGEGGGSDSFTISNLGEGPANVTLMPSGNFFTISPTSFSIGGGASQVVTISGTPQPAGSYQGQVVVSGAGAGETVRVLMLSATPPSGRVDPRPAEARSEVSSQQGQGASGSVVFTNHGSATLQGIAVSDVPWIVPQSGIITIPAGQTASVAFTIDASKRPDDAPVGSVTGKMSLVYISGTGSNLRTGILGSGAPSSSVSVTLVHVARPNVAQGAPPPLQPGERALFVSGVSSSPRVSDLILSNPSTSSVGELRLYLSGLPGNAQNALLPTLQPNNVIAFPAVVKTVFGAPAASGSAQVRAADVSRISIAATHLRTSAPAGTFGTALPVFHSDRGVGSGGQIVLPGVTKSTGMQTDLVVQELTGNSAAFQVDFLSSAGAVIASLAQQSLAAFAFARFDDAVPSGASAARIRNVSAGAARIAAYGLIGTSAGDAWVVTDPSTEGSATDVLIVPVISAGTGAETSLFLTNRNEANGSVSIDLHAAAPSRRRAVSRGTTSTSLPAVSEATSTLNLAPLATGAIPVPSVPGYARITSASGAIAASARTFRSANGEVFGSGLPVVPASAGLTNGQRKRFAGVEDAGSETRAAATPATFRTNLVLIESGGQPAAVRVTLHYSFAMSALATGQAQSMKEFTMAAGQFLQVTDLARQVIGSERESFGDLRNISVDIEVVSGSGRVVPFLHIIDNGSGDSIVRTE
ncbi:MAG TPA: hypothetical protein VFM36_11885 [Thermoanaerobaculia bacterium]|nr:hypothetical protein [Thermoanaerobaculia bacterium]